MGQKKDLNKFMKISLLCAIALVLMYIEFPITPFPWLKIDLSDVPALMGAFAFGPVAGIIIEIVKNILIVLVKGTQSAFVGEIANILIGISLVVPSAVIYRKWKTTKSAVIGMIVGALCMQIVGILANIYLLLPLYGMHLVGAALINYILIGLVPFNGIKAIVASVITFLLYKRLAGKVFKREGL